MYVYITSTMDSDLVGNIQAAMCHLQHKYFITQGIYLDPPKTFLSLTFHKTGVLVLRIAEQGLKSRLGVQGK